MRISDWSSDVCSSDLLAPNEPLIAYGLASRLVALDDTSRLPEAIGILKKVTLAEPDNGSAWQQLAVAYGRTGDIGMAPLASAERFLVQGDLRAAQGQADRAAHLMKEGTPGWLRAQGIHLFAKDQQIGQAAGRERCGAG